MVRNFSRCTGTNNSADDNRGYRKMITRRIAYIWSIVRLPAIFLAAISVLSWVRVSAAVMLPSGSSGAGPLSGVKAQYWMLLPLSPRAALSRASRPRPRTSSSEFRTRPRRWGICVGCRPSRTGTGKGCSTATQFGNYCTQPDGAGGTFGDEDCLTLNIYRPHQMKNANQGTGVPVMVWIHGGGFVGGVRPTMTLHRSY
jgi:hypothetical protein